MASKVDLRDDEGAVAPAPVVTWTDEDRAALAAGDDPVLAALARAPLVDEPLDADELALLEHREVELSGGRVAPVAWETIAAAIDRRRAADGG